jgi:2-polyprenyl-6-methoxyphenol hydroxylase-like FAD-dependent oxidoreductase
VRALVIGGGIGGLAAATALRRAGHEVSVHEQAERYREVGAGLALSANASTALDALGLREAAAARGALGRRLVLRTATGKTLADFPLEAGAESLGIHRAALLEVLEQAAGPASIRFGATCRSISQDASGVTATFADGSTDGGDLLVGADGIRSTVRDGLFGPSPLRYAGYVGWRAVSEVEPHLIDRGVFWETWGRGIRFGCVEIGGDSVYWFVAETARADSEPPAGGPKHSFLQRLADWHEPVARVIESTPEDVLTRTPIYDRAPLDRWGVGRITLLGDAAHPMTPNLGQGASQALEDAAVLGVVARSRGEPTALLREYERRRVDRANLVLRRSRQAGRIAQARNPILCGIRDRVFTLAPARAQRAQQAKLIGFDPG